MNIKAFFMLLLLFFSSVTFSDNSTNNLPVIKIAILDNLMSQKLASEQYIRDYMDGVKTAQKASEALGFKVKYETFFYNTDYLSILKEINKIKKYHPDFIIGPRSSDNFLLLSHYFSNILVISPLASSEQVMNMPSNFHSMVFSDDFSASVIAQFVEKKFKKRNILAISEMDCNSCININRNMIEKYQKIYPSAHITEKKIISDSVEKINIRNLVNEYQNGDIIFLPGTSYASGVLITRIVNMIKKPVIFVGGDGWGSWSVSYVGKLHVNFPYTAYRIAPRFIEINSNKYKEFKEIYLKTISKKIPEDAITYITYSTIMSVIHSVVDIKNNTITPTFIFEKYSNKLKENLFYFKPASYDVYIINNNSERFLKTIPVNLYENITYNRRNV